MRLHALQGAISKYRVVRRIKGPRGTRLAERVAHRAAGSHRSQPFKIIDQSITSDVANGQYDTNWAGAAYAESEARIIHSRDRHVCGPHSQCTQWQFGRHISAAAWVGIDGYTCENAILQTGVDFTVDEYGDVSYSGTQATVRPKALRYSDDTSKSLVQLTVTASSTTSGTAYIENPSTGQTVTQDLSSSYALCEENAEWIVEDYEEDGSLVAFADFGTVTFTNAEATYDGETVGPSTATLINIEQNGEVLTSVSTDSSSVTISYQ
ncbi:uncharacterized protein LAESUDRAFT_809729 [Laetiporus sulphureus 93-53]|uniref:Concanavalin A-like lectin/glucanase n=1 Tax=Laetiporus sulphureus 93-53 TaxID=1314785 RepID=A0A165GUT1_9APHY|nr:uncharacterized protein LAESUDRAFT_809729 [Laetiporus sulphureus 93-53]KZT10841.1 hypothetical protein LAESUDRAFT_809729 [Laetiporus sulphureus 93-53]